MGKKKREGLEETSVCGKRQMSTTKFNTHKSLSSSADLVTLLCRRFEGRDFWGFFCCFLLTYLFISKEAGTNFSAEYRLGDNR